MGVIQNPSLSSARQLDYDIFNLFDSGLTDEVYIIYTSFYGETKNRPVIRRLLPILESDYDEIAPLHKDMDIVYEPSPKAVFDMLIPQYTAGILFEAMVQACAAEHFARMNAMESATDNADEMLGKLRLQYNMARQSAITREITEIAGASMSDISGV